MALEADDLAAIREWVGSTPADSVLEATWARHENVYRVALEVLRARRADALATGDLAIEGFYREGAPPAKALELLEGVINELEGLIAGDDDDGIGTAGPDGFAIGQMVRRDGQRRAGTALDAEVAYIGGSRGGRTYTR